MLSLRPFYIPPPFGEYRIELRLPTCFRSSYPIFSLPLPHGERQGARGKVKACSAAQTLKPLQPCSIASLGF